MPVLEILKYPDEVLKQISEPVEVFNDELLTFLSALEETMRAGPGGVGIAAPQVGRFHRIAIVDVSAKPKIKHNGCMILINPEIKTWEGMKVGRVRLYVSARLHRQCHTSRKNHLTGSQSTGRNHQL